MEVILIIGCYVAIIGCYATTYRSLTNLSNHLNSKLDKFSQDLFEFRLEVTNRLTVIETQIAQIIKNKEK